MTKKLEHTLLATADHMADALIDEAQHEEVDFLELAKITIGNFNTLLDELFSDGGNTRCEKFCDLAWPYSLQFGPMESQAFDHAQSGAISKAIRYVQIRAKSHAKFLQARAKALQSFKENFGTINGITKIAAEEDYIRVVANTQEVLDLLPEEFKGIHVKKSVGARV